MSYTPRVRELPRSLVRAIEQGGTDLTIAAVRLGAMGDILRTLPAVRILRRSLPRAKLYWIAEDKWSSVLEGHPDLDSVVGLPRKQLHQSAVSPLRWPALLRGLSAFRGLLHGLHLELVLDFHGNLRSGIATRLTGAPVRLGYAGHQQKEGNHWLTTHRVASGERRTPRMERNLALVRALGIDTADLPPLDLPLVRAGDADAVRLLGELGLADGTHAVVSPGASAHQAYKTPPPELLAAACQRLAARGIRALVVYGPGEVELAHAVVAAAGDDAVLAPPTSLAALAALTSRARLFVGGDSGPLHLACAVGCAVLGLYGPTDPQVNQPWGVPYRTVFPAGRNYTGIKREDRKRGFDGLTPGQVEQAVDELLSVSSSGGG